MFSGGECNVSLNLRQAFFKTVDAKTIEPPQYTDKTRDLSYHLRIIDIISLKHPTVSTDFDHSSKDTK